MILLSYNHLIHQQVKPGTGSSETQIQGMLSGFNINLESSVLIIDEGHNISDTSDEAMSFSIEKHGLIEGCLRELDQAQTVIADIYHS